MNEFTCKEEIEEERLPFIGNVGMKLAHEIRNPLMTVRGYLQYFLETEGAEKEKLDIVLNILIPEIDRANKFISDFLLFSRPFTPQRQYTYINHLVQEFRYLVLRQLMVQNTDIILDLSPDLNKYPLYIDAAQIVQVMLSLFLNSIEAKEKPTMCITIQTKVSDETAYVCFKDDGKGMDAYILSQAFNPFFSAKEVGMGLGLPVSQKIIAMHGGTINIRSRKGRGTAVTFTLPYS
jgi:signal transduction histidine kinase